VAAASLGSWAVVEVIDDGHGGLASDHARLVVRLPGHIDFASPTVLGGVRWRAEADWSLIFSTVKVPLRFVSGWAVVAMRHPTLRQWVSSGRKKGTRQVLLDLAAWWRAALYTVAAHSHGAAKVAHPPRPRDSCGDLLRLFGRDFFRPCAWPEPWPHARREGPLRPGAAKGEA
jgi:hypothetical protein